MSKWTTPPERTSQEMPARSVLTWMDPGTGPCANRRGRARATRVPLQEHFPSDERSRRDVELQLPFSRRICSLSTVNCMYPRSVRNVFYSLFQIWPLEFCQASS